MAGSLDGLRLLCAVARGSSIATAAAALGYSRSQAGRLLRRVQRSAGQPLLVTSNQGTELTPRAVPTPSRMRRPFCARWSSSTHRAAPPRPTQRPASPTPSRVSARAPARADCSDHVTPLRAPCWSSSG